jgi:hypothetical protein
LTLSVLELIRFLKANRIKIFDEICNKESFIVFTVEGNVALSSQILKLGQQ